MKSRPSIRYFLATGIVLICGLIISLTVSLYKDYTIYFFEFKTECNASTVGQTRMHYALEEGNLTKSCTARLHSKIKTGGSVYRLRLPMAEHRLIQLTLPTGFSPQHLREPRIVRPSGVLHYSLDSELHSLLENKKEQGKPTLTFDLPKGLAFPFFGISQFWFRLLLNLAGIVFASIFGMHLIANVIYQKEEDQWKRISGSTYLGLFLLVAGSKLIIISYAGSIVPFGDQWIEVDLYKSYMNGELSLAELLVPHNEHHILLNRVSSLFLFEINGRVWDPLLLMIFCAVLHSLTIVFFLHCLTKVFGRRYLLPLAMIVILVSLIPSAWENILWGFQICFYFYLLFGMMMIHIITSKELSFRNVLVVTLLSILSFLSIAAGLISTIAVILVLFVGVCRRPRLRNDLFLMTFLLPLAALFWVLTPEVDHHKELLATGPLIFCKVFLQTMSWPFSGEIWPAFILNLPMLFICVRFFLKKREKEPQFRLLLGIFFWIILHSAAIAYARNNDHLIPSRYTDLSSLIVVVNFSAFIVLLTSTGQGKDKNFILLFQSLWIFLVIIGSAQLLENSLISIEGKKNQGIEHTETIVDYLSTGDPKIINSYEAYDQGLPFPIPRILLQWLDDPAVLDFLPLELHENEKSGSISWLRKDLLANGISVAFIGIFLLLLLPLLLFFKRITQKT